MRNLPAKSSSRGIQRSHVRKLMTRSGVKAVSVNPGVKKRDKVASRPVRQLAVRPRSDVQSVQKPVPGVVLRPKARRPSTWWDADEFREKALDKREILGIFHSVSRPEAFMDDVWETFVEESPYKSEEEAEAGLETVIDHIEQDGDFAYMEGRERVALTPFGDFDKEDGIPTEDEFEVSRWDDPLDERVIGFDGDRPDGPGSDFDLLLISGSITPDDIRDPDQRESGFKPEEEKGIQQAERLIRQGIPFFLVNPWTWYQSGTPIAVRKKDRKKAQDVLDGKFSEFL